MTNRRSFMAGMAAVGLCPKLTWASIGPTSYISAARKSNGAYALFGLNHVGGISFEVPLPDRGHAVAAHPKQPEIVGFARRPGRFALVVDCADGLIRQVLEPPKGRHFYGHGTYTKDGKYLFTSENDFENSNGIIGVWSVDRWYERIGEFPSNGIGPHDVKLMPDGKHLVVANGGIETHPDSGRQKLNIPVMEPNLTYLTLKGDVTDQLVLPRRMHKNSIRHLGVGSDGQVAFGMQWQGDVHNSPALIGLHKPGQKPRLLEVPDHLHQRLKGYVGSIAYSAESGLVAATSPRGNLLLLMNARTGHLVEAIEEADVCGVALRGKDLICSAGTGEICVSLGHNVINRESYSHQWDNHLVPLA